MAAYTTIDDAGLFYNTVLYTGTDTSGTGTVTGVGFQPDFVWGKVRSKIGQHNLFDAVRGAGERLISNGTDGEETNAAYGYLSAFDSDGFTTSAGSTNNENWNETSETFASWNWKGGTTSGITTDGSTTITPSAYSFSATSGVSILKYGGNSTSGAGLAHGLGVKPDFLIMKKTNSAGTDWQIYHQSVGYSNSGDLALNTTSGQGAQTNFSGEPDATNIFLGGNTINNNSGDTYVCYAFAGINGFSKFDTYVGNGNADGTFVYTGFRPAYVMNKRFNSSGSWKIHNSKVPAFNVCNLGLAANTTAAESAVDGVDRQLDLLSNGFKWRATDTDVNYAGSNYIYMAFAESPFVNSESVPTNAR
jgi:hypothetical protein